MSNNKFYNKSLLLSSRCFTFAAWYFPSTVQLCNSCQKRQVIGRHCPDGKYMPLFLLKKEIDFETLLTC